MRVGLLRHVGGQQHTRENSVRIFLPRFFPRRLFPSGPLFASLLSVRVALSVSIATAPCSLCPLPSVAFSDPQLVLRRVVVVPLFAVFILRRHPLLFSLLPPPRR